MSRHRGIGPAGMQLAALKGAPSLIKSIQRGTIALVGVTSNSATITAVDPANSELVYLGENGTNAGDNPGIGWGGLELTNATTVTATRTVGTDTLTVSYEVVEYMPGVIRRVQRGVSGALVTTPTTITILSVNPSKTRMSLLGRNHGAFVYTVNYSEASFALTDQTTITITCVAAGATAGVRVYWQAVEFY